MASNAIDDGPTGRRRVTGLRHSLVLATCAAATCLAGLASPALLAQSSKSAIPQDPSRLIIVDCLLPGQVRKLGGQMTYLSPRRPVRTTVSDCEIRGGEYVAYDRANYATALKVWMPQAEAGDPEAQTYVGEIFEKGLGIPPDYQVAAKWYQKAADQGFAKAQMNLAYLYEQGLGVAADPLMALNLYRKASGITGDDLTFASEVTAVRSEMQAQIDQLTTDLESQNDQVAALQKELGASREQLAGRRNALVAAQREAQTLRVQVADLQAKSQVDPQQVAELGRLKQELLAREAKVAQQEQSVAALEASAAAKQAQLSEQLAAASAQDFKLRDELGATASQNDALRKQLEDRQAQLVATDQQVAELRAQLADERASLASDRERLVAQSQSATASEQQKVSELSAQLQSREASLAQQQTRIDELLDKQRAYVAELSQLRTQQAQSVATQQAQAAQIESTRSQLASAQQRLLDTDQRVADLTAQLDADRSRLTVERDRLAQQSAVAGTAQAAQIEQLRKDVAARDARLAELQATIAGLQTEKQQYQAQVEQLRSQESERVAMRSIDATPPKPAVVAPLTKLPKELRAGNYYALIIGNNHYQNMPTLETAVNDAKALDEVLRERYGFKTTLLLDADRAQILTALNDYRTSLKTDDSLLVYYAGHGELDAQNLRGYWLPVNAQRGNTTEWISDQQVTDQIALMQAKHVLVVADSCYSGAMTRSSALTLKSLKGDQINLLIKKAKLPSRTVLTSGGEQPVLDVGGGQHSIFAKVLLEILKSNDGVLEGSALYDALFDPVRQTAAQYKVDQSPRYSQLADAGHLNGEFLFIPRT
jgi:Caspase domain/Sel1 repeat